MPVCSPDSAPWCGRPLIHEPNPNYVNRLTPAHVALYLEIAKVGVRLLRDDLQFDEVKEMFGRQVYYDIDDKEYTFARPELKGVTFVITLADPVDGASNSVEGFDIKVTELLDGIRKNDLEAKLELQRASNYVAFSLDPRTDVDFSYEVGMDTISCYPVFINLNFFKDEAYATVTPGQTKRRNTWDRSP